MKKEVFSLVAVLALVGLMGGMALASNTANQTVTYQVSAINEISASGNPAAMNVNAATAGSQPTEVSDTSTTYSVTTNGTAKKITAAINTAMPSGVTLKVALAAPTGGTSLGDVTLTDTAADVVTGITQLAESAKGITYKLSATAAAGVVGSASKTVTLTLADGA